METCPFTTNHCHCDLAITNHGERTHKQIILVVNRMFLGAVFEQWVSKILWLTTTIIYACISLPQIVMVKL